MLKLIINYIREQKKNFLQIFGLGILVFLMVSSFLSINFATNYVKNQYWNEIAMQQFHQRIAFWEKPQPATYQKLANSSWLSNLNYQYRDKKTNKIVLDEEKLTRATFQLNQADGYDGYNNNYVYSFVFYNDMDKVFIGENLKKEAKNKPFEIKFKLNLPNALNNDGALKKEADIFNKYVYHKKADNSFNDENQQNFMLLSEEALDLYNAKIFGNREVSLKRTMYESENYFDFAFILQRLVMNMLFGKENLFTMRDVLVRDLIMTGKTFRFIESRPEDKFNLPILINDGGKNIKEYPLKNNEILIYEKFAQINNLKVGQEYVFAGKKYLIRGFATSSLATDSGYYFDQIIDNKNQTVAFVNTTTYLSNLNYFENTNNQNTIIYGINPENSKSLTFNNKSNYWIYQFLHQKLLTELKTIPEIAKHTRLPKINNGIQTINLLPGANTDYFLENRTLEDTSINTINTINNTLISISSVFLILIFIVTVVIIFIILYKIIDKNKRMIGILKALGFKEWKINIAMLSSLIIPLIIFAIIGIIVGFLFSHVIIMSYSSIVILANYGFNFKWLTSFFATVLPIIGLFIFGFFSLSFLLRIKPLFLINNQWGEKKSNKISEMFSKIINKVTPNNTSYVNKLAILTVSRSFSKSIFTILVSIFASTLLLFSFTSSGLINNMLGLKFAAIQYKNSADYRFNQKLAANFINSDGQLLYKKETVSKIKSKPSLYLPLKEAIEKLLSKQKPVTIDTRYGYIMGSELLKIRRTIIEANFKRFPKNFRDYWDNNLYYIDYLTNGNNENSEKDLLITFGLIPYDNIFENVSTALNFLITSSFDVNKIDWDNFNYDNKTKTFSGNFTNTYQAWKNILGINSDSQKFLDLGLNNSEISNFNNLNLNKMMTSNYWLDKNFIQTRELILNKLKITDPKTASLQVVPVLSSVVPAFQQPSTELNNIGKALYFEYTGFDLQKKYFIGVVYDTAKNLISENTLIPENWLKKLLFNNKVSLANDFGNSKFSNFEKGEFSHYFSMISTKNDYNFDLAKITNNEYREEKGISPAVSRLIDINVIKDLATQTQYALQFMITMFVIFSILLSLLIIIIISNINIRDNLLFISILRSIGFTDSEVSYIFLVTLIPLIIIFALISVFIAPTLTTLVSWGLSSFTKQVYPVIFKWYFYAIILAIVLLIYLISYLVTWKLNVKNYQLLELTK